MTTEEKIEIYNKLNVLLLSNDKIKNELSDHFSDIWELKDVFEKVYSKKELLASEAPFLMDWLTTHSLAIANIVQDYIKGPKFSIQLNFDGKNICGWEALINSDCNPQHIYDYSCYLVGSIHLFATPLLFVAAQDSEHERHRWAQDMIKGSCNLLNPSQVCARFNLSAAIFGDTLVNDALLACGCFSLEELRFMAE